MTNPDTTTLKSDHFGIEILQMILWVWWLSLLKSDHFGIEITVPNTGGRATTRLKSDHFGIEINTRTITKIEFNTVKIRPFWD